jgi:hypothetical protein
MKMMTAMRQSKATAPMAAPIPALAPVDIPPEPSTSVDPVGDIVPDGLVFEVGGGPEVVLPKRKPGVKGCVSKMERSDDCHRICITCAVLGLPGPAVAKDGHALTTEKPLRFRG